MNSLSFNTAPSELHLTARTSKKCNVIILIFKITISIFSKQVKFALISWGGQYLIAVHGYINRYPWTAAKVLLRLVSIVDILPEPRRHLKWDKLQFLALTACVTWLHRGCEHQLVTDQITWLLLCVSSFLDQRKGVDVSPRDRYYTQNSLFQVDMSSSAKY